MLYPKMTSSGRVCQCPQNVVGTVPTTSLLEAYYGNIEPYREWVAQGGDVNASLHIGYNFLYAASCGGQSEIVREILDHPNIHLNHLAREDSSSLMTASMWGHEECIRLLLSATPKEVMNEIFVGNSQAFRDWIKNGGDVTDCHSLGHDFFYLACAGGHPNLLWEILQHPNVHLNKICKWGNAGLSAAARWGQTKCIEVLLTTEPKSNCRLDITHKNLEGLTALAIAAQCRKWNVIPYLLIPEVEYDMKNLDTVLHETSKSKEWDLVVKALRTYQGFSSQKISEIFFLATKNRQTEVLKTVLRFHFDSCDSQTLNLAREWAIKFNYNDEKVLLTRSIEGYCRLDYGISKVWIDKRHNDREIDKLHGFKDTFDIASLSVSPAKTSDGRVCIIEPQSNTPPLFQLTDQQLSIAEGFSTSPRTSWLPKVGPLQIKVIPVKNPVPPGPDVYDTTSIPRGIVLILNYNNFKDRPDMRREGSYFDVLNMRCLCEQMGYEAQVHSDLSSEETLQTLENFASQVRLGQMSCALVAIMSHGVSRHTFYASDMKTVTVNEVQNLFLDNKCPLLKNKPKIFLFNFCRGIDVPAALETDAIREQPRNILCIYSTTESFLSFRDRNKGCPFIIALCEVLANHAHEMDLDNLIRKFQQKYLPNTTPEIQNLGFYKKFFFNPIGL